MHVIIWIARSFRHIALAPERVAPTLEPRSTAFADLFHYPALLPVEKRLI